MKKLRTIRCVSNSLCAAVMLSTMFTLNVSAAVTDRTLGGGTNGALPSGSHTWEVNANWTGDDFPDTFGINGEQAIVGDATADRTLTTTGDITIERLQWLQSTDLPAGQANRISLGGDLTVNLLATVGNTTTGSDPSRMVMNLNGYTLNLAAVSPTFDNFTLVSGGGGTMTLNGSAISNVNLVGDVTVSIKSTTVTNQGVTGDHDAASTYLIDNDGDDHRMFIVSSTTGYGNLVLGNAAGTTNPTLTWDHATGIGVATQIQSDVIVHPNATFTFASETVFTRVFNVGGNFIDTNTTGGYGDNDDAVIIFNGNPITPRTVNIARTALATDFRVGNIAADPGAFESLGNIILGNDLTTTGDLTIRTDSTINPGLFTVAVDNIVADSGAIFQWSFGLTNGLFTTLGDVTLSGAILQMINQPPATGLFKGDLITLFDNMGPNAIGGTFAGLLEGDIVQTSNGRAFATISYIGGDGNDVVLTLIPEPTSIASVAVGLLLLSRRRRMVTTK